jgi:hypothetical protein
MGAGYVTGTALETEISFRASVGGPLSTLRTEGASLLQLLFNLNNELSTPLLVFVDCLVLLDILQRWGQVSFRPHPADIVHFDVIFPLLNELASAPLGAQRARSCVLLGPAAFKLTRIATRLRVALGAAGVVHATASLVRRGT